MHHFTSLLVLEVLNYIFLGADSCDTFGMRHFDQQNCTIINAHYSVNSI